MGILAFDIDGGEAQKHFDKMIETLGDSQIADAIRNTMQTRTGGSYSRHIILRVNPLEFIGNGDCIRTATLWRGNGFIKNSNGIATTDQYEKIVSILRKETSLPISIEHNFKFLVLLPLEANEKIEALKQYYGVTRDHKLVVRGVEIRRHDTPNLIKQFQTELLSTLFDCKSKEEIISKGYENALLLVTKAIDKIMIGGEDVTKNDLVISKLLGHNIEKYRRLFPHVSAAIQLSNEGKHPSKGDTIKYIYSDSQHKNPLCRVVPIENIHQSNEKEVFSYDKEKYREMILDGAETVLGYFGFDRTVYGNKKNTAARKWWWLEELRQEREKDIKAETI